MTTCDGSRFGPPGASRMSHVSTWFGAAPVRRSCCTGRPRCICGMIALVMLDSDVAGVTCEQPLAMKATMINDIAQAVKMRIRNRLLPQRFAWDGRAWTRVFWSMPDDA